MKNTIIFILFCLVSSGLLGQKLDHKFYEVPKGLSQGTVTTIVQDEFGFLWIGTRYGLNRYDGKTFIQFESNVDDSLSLSNNYIRDLLADQNGKLWIGTYGGGLNIYDIHKKKMERFDNELSDNHVNVIYKDPDGLVWIGTGKGGLNLCNPQTMEFDDAYVYREGGRKMPHSINAISGDHLGNVWVGTWTEGLFSINHKTGVISSYENIIDGELSGIRCLHQSLETVWVGTNNGIRRIVQSGQNVSFENVQVQDLRLLEELNQSIVLSIYEDASDNLWIGTENNGLFVIVLKEQRIVHYKKEPGEQYGLLSNSIWAFLGDRDGNLWIGTYLKGLMKKGVDQQNFELVDKALIDCDYYDFDLVSGFAEDASGKIWIGTDGSGLFYHDSNQKQFKHYGKGDKSGLTSNEITSILIDQKQNLWVGTWNGGVNVLKSGEDIFEVIRKENTASISGDDIHHLFEDSKGRIWIAAFRKGLDLYDPEKDEFYYFNPDSEKRKIESVYVRTLIEDQQGNIWIGTEQNGLQRITLNDKNEIIGTKFFFNDEITCSINAIFEDSKGGIWVGTEGNGLYKYDGEVDVFAKKEGLPSNMIFAIVEDEEGMFWISTNKGLSAFNSSSEIVTNYDIENGLQATEFYKSSCLKTQNNEIYFGGINGFNRFFPEQVKKTNLEPELYVTNILVSNEPYVNDKSEESRSIFNDQNIKLKYSENDLTVNFTAINFADSDKNLYEYKMENYDDNWRNAGAENTAYYSNIPPGNYVFQIKASNVGEDWVKKAQFDLKITKPWYATYLAWLAYLLIFSLALFWAMNIILSKERIKNQLSLEQVELQKMQELDELKTQFFANVSHEFKTPLTLIITPLKLLSSKSGGEDKNVNIMLKNAERLYRLINQILDISKIESGFETLSASEYDIVGFVRNIAINFTGYADENDIDFIIDFPKKEISLFYEKQKLEKAFVNLFSNAFKYTSNNGKVIIELEELEDAILFKVSDTGIGIPQEELDLIFERYYKAKENYSTASTGIGLSLTKQIIELHKGSISVESEVGKGTTFVVKLIRGKEHLGIDSIIKTQQDFNYSEESLIEMQEFEVGFQNFEDDADIEEENNPIVLVAEDNDDLRSFVCENLSDKYSVLEAENGEVALKMAKENLPDILITDVMMPKMDGYELVKQLKNDPITCHIFIIMLTVKSSEDSYEKGLMAGVNDYLTKPFNYNLLELRIQNLLLSRQKFKEQFLSQNTLKLEPSEVHIESADEKFVKDFIESIEQNISNPNYKIENFCRDLGFSKSQFYRKTKSLLGQTPNQFVRTIKLKRAAQLLEVGEFKISEITYKVGFNDLKYFRSCFKKQYGMTPSNYIAQKNEAKKEE